MGEYVKDSIKERLEDAEIERPPIDAEEYVRPTAGGCWICHREVDRNTERISFSIAFDTWYHAECLEKTGCETITEFEREF